jgi:spore maturation protein CgeB
LKKLGHEVILYEPLNGWSLQSLIHERGIEVISDFEKHYPLLTSKFYHSDNFDLNEMLFGADLVIVHEWNSPHLIEEIGLHRKRHEYVLFFHDTHHRAVSNPEEMGKFNLSNYDGVLAFGEKLKQVYQSHQWHSQVWIWHEAADVDLYVPLKKEKIGDLVWIGNWGDEERTQELKEYLIEPIQELGLSAKFYGVRYPEYAIQMLKEANIEYGGYLPAHQVPSVFAQYKMTAHIPRRFYRESLPGIPTIRPFEAMACKIPLLSSPWNDSENLFTLNKDFRMAHSKEEMKQNMMEVLSQPELWNQITHHAYQNILHHHTCEVRVDELLSIFKAVKMNLKHESTH